MLPVLGATALCHNAQCILPTCRVLEPVELGAARATCALCRVVVTCDGGVRTLFCLHTGVGAPSKHACCSLCLSEAIAPVWTCGTRTDKAVVAWTLPGRADLNKGLGKLKAAFADKIEIEAAKHERCKECNIAWFRRGSEELGVNFAADIDSKDVVAIRHRRQWSLLNPALRVAAPRPEDGFAALKLPGGTNKVIAVRHTFGRFLHKARVLGLGVCSSSARALPCKGPGPCCACSLPFLSRLFVPIQRGSSLLKHNCG